MNPYLSTRGRLAAGLWCALLLALPVCLAAQPQSPGDAVYFPLEPGRTFVYRHEVRSAPVETHRSVIARLPIHAGPVAEVEHRVGGKVSDYSYHSVGKDGVYQHDKLYIGPMRGVSPSGASTLKLPFPVLPGTVREFEEVLKVQTSGGPLSKEDQERLRVEVRIEVQAIDEPVEVPAGRFLCARVVTTWTFHDGRKQESVAHYARHIGLVKSGDQELIAFGFAPPPPAPERVLEEALKGLAGPAPQVKWCGSTALQFLRSRFARVDLGSGARLYRVFGQEAALFEVTDVAHWHQLLADEGFDLGGGGAATLLPMRLAGAAATLSLWLSAPEAEAQGYGSSTTRFEGQNRKSTEVTVRGDGRVITGVIVTENTDLVDVKIVRGD